MAGGSTGRAAACLLASVGVLATAQGARALEAFDGRVQVHGFVEEQLRTLSSSYQEEFDLAQWYNVLNVELELDIAPNGFGPIDLLQGYLRVEGRYDCVYSRGCGMLRSVNTYGDRAKRLPGRLRNAVDEDYGGVIMTGDETIPQEVRRIQNQRPSPWAQLQVIPNELVGGTNELLWTDDERLFNDTWIKFLGLPERGYDPTLPVSPANRPEITIVRDREGFPGFDTLFKTRGADAELGIVADSHPLDGSLADVPPDMPQPRNDDPANYVFAEVMDYLWTFRSKKGPGGGTGRTQVMGPWLPKNFIRSLGTLSDRANPFRGITPPTRNGLISAYRPVLGGPLVPLPNGQTNRVPQSRTTDLPPGFYGDIYPTASPTGDIADPRIVEFFLQPDTGYLPGAPQPHVFPNIMTTTGGVQLDGSGFGGDFSGIIPFYTPDVQGPTAAQRQIQGTLPPAPGAFPRTNIAAIGGTGELPARPAPDKGNLAEWDQMVAQGLYIPSSNLRRALAEQDFDDNEFNFTDSQRSWNRGQSQQETKEVKEAYIDVEVLDSRLWGRFGLQNIVWGKTELFRTTDQFNPQDLALASLASLEESRIALFAGRFVYSLYDVGPLEDVRAEFAFNFDRYKPADLGACGEAFTPDLVCGITTGLFFHGVTGVGIAGIDRPPNPWESIKGLEIGGRIEWRWDRFSFALMDFWGYHDTPYPDTINYYERNVDPNTGRPRIAGATGDCKTSGAFLFASGSPQVLFEISYASPSSNANPGMQGGLGMGVDPDCLKAGGAAGENNVNENHWDPDDYQPLLDHLENTGPLLTSRVYNPAVDGPLPVLYDGDGSPQNALENHSANQQLFAFICSGTVTIAASVDPGACAWTVFTSGRQLTDAAGTLPLTEVLSSLFAGEHNGDAQSFFNTLTTQTKGRTVHFTPVRNLNDDVLDGSITALNPGFINPAGTANDLLTLDQVLTNEQRALIGCGPFFGTRCDSGRGGVATNVFTGQSVGYQGPGWSFGGGMDVLNTEASAILQSFPGFEGTTNGWTTTNRELGAQPGTIGFQGGPVCTRVVNGEVIVLPGCRGVRSLELVAGQYQAVFDNGYNVRQDGCIFGRTAAMATVNINGTPVVGTDQNGNPVDLSSCITSRTRQAAVAGQNGYGFGTDGNLTVVVAGARTLFHPLAGCLSAADVNSPIASERECDFQLRNFDLEYANGTAQIFSSEMAALSFNLLMFLITGGSCDKKERSIDFDPACFNAEDPWRADKCSFAAPQLCDSVKGFLGVAGPNSNKRVAGGNERFGRRDFLWHSGGELALRYAKRNVFGISTDFAEDVTKTNWSMEFTWMGGVPYVDAHDYDDGVTESDSLNLTISVDRPTFINFLNANRTFFFNSQWFFDYLTGYNKGFTTNGPFNVLFTFAMFTGYYQDRLLPTLVSVYDFRSRSGGLLPSITYRFNENFSVTTGINFFWGRGQYKDMQVRAWAPTSNRAGEHAYDDGVENRLSVINRRDEVFLRLRYTF